MQDRASRRALERRTRDEASVVAAKWHFSILRPAKSTVRQGAVIAARKVAHARSRHVDSHHAKANGRDDRVNVRSPKIDDVMELKRVIFWLAVAPVKEIALD